ncbi:MAG: hypothetical protein HWE14_03830 [Flavobacteriia bacterium]|nr:hypothetical protein [Flavobacteriia bacterium]
MNEEKLSYEVPAEGSLAILALGSVGIRAWRKAVQDQSENQLDEEN